MARNDKEITLLNQWISKLQNHPLIAIICLVSIAFVGFDTTVEAIDSFVEKIWPKLHFIETPPGKVVPIDTQTISSPPQIILPDADHSHSISTPKGELLISDEVYTNVQAYFDGIEIEDANIFESGNAGSIIDIYAVAIWKDRVAFFVRGNCNSPSVCTTKDFYILLIEDGQRPRIIQNEKLLDIDKSIGTEAISIRDNKIVIDFGFIHKKRLLAVFDGNQLSFEETRLHASLGEDDCRWLSEQQEECKNENTCEHEPQFNNQDIQYYYGMKEHRPGFNFVKFEKICFDVCTSKISIKYDHFKNEVCRI